MVELARLIRDELNLIVVGLIVISCKAFPKIPASYLAQRANHITFCQGALVFHRDMLLEISCQCQAFTRGLLFCSKSYRYKPYIRAILLQILPVLLQLRPTTNCELIGTHELRRYEEFISLLFATREPHLLLVTHNVLRYGSPAMMLRVHRCFSI
jgi:hypothetical protein